MVGNAHLDIVICTHNRSAALAKVLDALAVQRAPADMSWAVLVVDNASTDDTAAVATDYRTKLDLRYVLEPTLGLTHARQRGFAETTGQWIGFVDDDNLLEPGWIAAIGETIGAFPGIGGVGGRVKLTWATRPPAAVAEFGFCFAEQDLGEKPRELESLVGAGMVLKREALCACGWAAEPLLADRIGKSLISGGDVEMALRVRGAGYVLRYEPRAAMQHLMPAGRATAGYLLRINRSLGATSAMVSLLGWAGDYQSWRQSVRRNNRQRLREALAGLWWSMRTGQKRLSAAAWLAYAFGCREGVAQVARLSRVRRDALLGLAVPAAP
ncbi:MAG: glycosyl transferase family 2 [Sphingomonas bacterium]|nr:glycosyl transferase family 2 [Sphingomonas bacterium]